MWQPTHVKVTVKQAKNLISKGKNGTNDAFVVIGIGKEKYQTSIKEKCSSLVEWKEECELAIPSQGNKATVQLTVYHHNSLGMDEFLGQVPLPLTDFDVYEKPKYRFYRLKGKPEKDKKKGEKERGELEVMVNFTVKSESFLDVSGKKEKHKSSLTSLKHLGGSLMSIGSKEKQGLKNFARSVSSKMDKIAKPKRKKSKAPSDGYSGGVLSNDLMTSQQYYGDADPGVISDEDDDDDFRFEDDVKISTRTSSPLSTMSRGSSLMHDQVLDTDNEVGSSEDHDPEFSSRFDKIPIKPPRIIDETVENSVPLVLQPHSSSQRITSFSDPKPQIKVAPPTPEISQTIIEEEFSFEDHAEKPSPSPPEKPVRLFEEPVWELKRKGSPESQSLQSTSQKIASKTAFVNNTTDVRSEPSEPALQTPVPKEPIKESVVRPRSPLINRKIDSPFAKTQSNSSFPKEESFMSAQSLGDSAVPSDRSFMSFVESEKSLASDDISGYVTKDVNIPDERSDMHFKTTLKESEEANPKTDVFLSNDETQSIRDGRDSAISLGNDPDGGFSSVTPSRPRSTSNASSVISTTSSSSSPLDAKEKTGVEKPFEEIPYSKPKTLLKSSSDMDVLLRRGSGGRRRENGKRVLSAADSVPSYIDNDDPAIVRSGSLSEKRTTSAQPSLVDEWERKLYGRHGLTGSTENVSMSGSRSSLNASRESSVHDVRADDAITRFPEVKALTLERKTNLENEEDAKKNKRKQKTGFKHRIFNKIGGSRERLNEDSRIVEGGNDRLPSIPAKSKLPQEVHDKFAGKSREDLLEVILHLQSSLEKQVKHSSELEEYIDNLLLRVMEATPAILQVPLKTASGFKGY